MSNNLFTKAAASYQEGKLDEAEEIVTSLLSAHPKNADIPVFLGIVRAQKNNTEEAVLLFKQALALNPAHATAHQNLGDALIKLKKYEEALSHHDQSIAINPNNADAHQSRGTALYELERYDEALKSCDRAVTINSNHADAYNTRAAILQKQKQYSVALASANKAIAINPAYANAYNSRGLAEVELNHYDEALASFAKAIECDPRFVMGHTNYANVLVTLGRYEEATEYYDKAITLDPGYAEAYNNRGTALRSLNRYDEAIADHNKAITLNPKLSAAYNNRGLALSNLRQDAAMADYNKAIALIPEHPDAYWNKSILKLLLGEYDEGWKLYEWRWKTTLKSRIKVFDKPLWLGEESLKDKTILIHTEQGLGDTLQFCRYIPMVEALGAKVILWPPSGLENLLSACFPSVLMVVSGEAIPAFDFHCPLMSLPLAFGTRVETIPSKPYLTPQADYVNKWKSILDDKLGTEKLRVGLCWAGGIRPDSPNATRVDAVRSLKFSQLKPLLDCKDVAFVSLQLGPPKDQLGDSRVLDISSGLQDWSDTAAVVSLLDLVITVDTSVCHLVGALGKKFWLLNRRETCWRWFLDREDSPWYPTAKLFRQSTFGDWNPVIQRVKTELAGFT